jgi:hypothetical protein
MSPAAVSSATYSIIHEACPEVHDGKPFSCKTNKDIIRYAAGYIDDSDEEENAPTEYVHSLLLSAGAPQNTLNPLIDRLSTLINERIARNPMKRTLEPVRLESTVHMAANKGTGATLNLVGPKVDLDSVTGRKVETRVDVKKLEKVL